VGPPKVVQHQVGRFDGGMAGEWQLAFGHEDVYLARRNARLRLIVERVEEYRLGEVELLCDLQLRLLVDESALAGWDEDDSQRVAEEEVCP
jgi:hypothetical protein